jgi:hypothetical protein
MDCVREISTKSPLRAIWVSLALACALPTTGCVVTLSPLAKHTAAFSAATNTIVDNSEDAYRAANQLHHDEQLAAAIDAYGQPGWSPDVALPPLLTAEQLDARIKVLDALKAYAQALVTLTGSKKQETDLDAATTAAGAGLKGLSAAATPDIQKLFPRTGSAMTPMTAEQANIASTAIRAISQFLINGKVEKSLKTATGEMEPTVDALCKLLQGDVDVLISQGDVDSKTMRENEDQFILHNQIDPAARRLEIGKLIDLTVQQKASAMVLNKLKASLVELSLTHHALAAAAQGNNPESIKQHLVDLLGAAKDLSNYYKSLPTS